MYIKNEHIIGVMMLRHMVQNDNITRMMLLNRTSSTSLNLFLLNGVKLIIMSITNDSIAFVYLFNLYF